MQFEQALLSGQCSEPFSFLGLVSNDEGDSTIRVFLPFAKSVIIRNYETKEDIASLDALGNGIFETKVAAQIATYEVVADTESGEYTYVDPYQFTAEAYHAVHFIDHAPENLYKQAGAQLITTEQGIHGVRFAVFAPNASAISVMGDFNHWDKQLHPMQKTEMGYWVLYIPGLQVQTQYKFAIKDMYGNALPDKSDPLGFSQHQYPSHASVVYDHNGYQWQDGNWQQAKQKKNHYQQPMSIYEVHLGSWKRPDDATIQYLTYRDMADDLVNYAVDMGFTHLEMLPISEYPFDGSWGYQPVGLFAPTSRFGSPDDFKYLVDICHQNNIGVIIDWVPAHFPEDGHGLARFDGTCVYEYDDPRKGWHPDWNSCIYDFGKDTVRQFLVANALYWFDKFRVDGIRVDAVASMLYLDYSRNDGEWIPNVDGGNHNYEAISLLKWMNTEVYKQYPYAMTIAEESTSFAGVSKPVETGGLGFGFKWNMGWMHDSLHYIAKDPAYRRYHHGELSFSMVYAYDENFVLPISHDEVVHGKGSMLQKMPGDEWQKFANLRAYYGFMFAHPGKKLQFMGNELAPYQEWDHDSELNWALLNHESHKGIQNLYRDLNKVYTSQPCLYQLDHQQSGFQWLDLDNADSSIFAFARYCEHSSEVIIAVINFTPSVHSEYRIGVPLHGKYQLILNTDSKAYAGSGFNAYSEIKTDNIESHGHTQSLNLSLPPLAALYYKVSN